MIFTARYSSPVGQLMLAQRDDALIGLWLSGQKYALAGMDEEPTERQTPLLKAAGAWLDRYFAGEKPQAGELMLRPQGSAFRRAVWQLLTEIPYGETTTYGALAQKLAAQTGRSTSARAVGGAVGHNPISIVVPCHRVVGANGSLTGYAGGLEAKVALLTHEGALPGKMIKKL